MVNMAVDAPIPRAMEIIAQTVISGFFQSPRNAILSLPIKIFILIN